MFDSQKEEPYGELEQEEILNNAVLLENDDDLKQDMSLHIEEIAQAGQNPEKDFRKCYYCLQKVSPSQLRNHLQSCKQEYKKRLEQSQVKYTNKAVVDEVLGQAKKKHKPDEMKMECKKCHKIINYSERNKHKNECFENQLSMEMIQFKDIRLQKQEKINISQFYGNICKWCSIQYPKEFHQIHGITCQIKENLQSYLGKCQLSQTQYKAIWGMYEKSTLQNQIYKGKMLEIVQRQGFNEGDLVLMSQFVQYQAPICIHFNLSKSISHFLKDTEYRNLFETKSSGGTSSTESRKQWQNHLFGNVYDNCQPNERIKYGVLNYANDKYGSKKCCKYGDSIMVLNDEVRKRCTIAHNRKYGPNQRVATLKYNYNVLRKFQPEELNALSLASRGFEVDSTELSKFKEVHIHGSIVFSRDIKCIYTSKQEMERNEASLAIFQMKFGVHVLTFEDLEAEQIE